MRAADPHPEPRKKLDEMERQWATDREIDESLFAVLDCKPVATIILQDKRCQ